MKTNNKEIGYYETSVVQVATSKAKKIVLSNVDYKNIYTSKIFSKELKVKITPKKAQKRKLKWSSNNKKVAIVSKTEKDTAKNLDSHHNM